MSDCKTPDGTASFPVNKVACHPRGKNSVRSGTVSARDVDSFGVGWGGMPRTRVDWIAGIFVVTVAQTAGPCRRLFLFPHSGERISEVSVRRSSRDRGPYPLV